jgi:hypothetical protein
MKRFATLAAGVGLALLAGAGHARAAESRRFALSVVVDGAPVPEYAWRNQTYVEAMRGRPFSLRVSNPTSERIAVAISVDGRNVIDARRSTAADARKWVLDPGQILDIPGWQFSGRTARHFFFTETSRSYANWLGDTANVGTIEGVFFREKIVRPQPMTQGPAYDPRQDRERPSEQSEAAGGVDGGAPAPPQSTLKSQAPSSASGRSRDSEAAGAQRKDSDGFAATGIGERTDFPIQWVSFDEDPRPAARIALRYEFHKELVRLGVLPRLDDLYAREHARGFEPEYAPDPDRHRAQ